jgi:hypothetical protein
MVCAADEQLASSELGIKNLREEGEAESSYIWKEHGIWMKVRPDWISADRKIILDYKTTGTSAQPEDFNGIIASTGLDIQHAFYKRGVHNIERSDPVMYFFIQETSEPYLCSLISLDPSFHEMGEQKVRRGMGLWAECLSTGIWPGYSPKIFTAEPKPWDLAKWEMRQLLAKEA